ncbi:Saposin B-type domain-containing protein [Caenorhabditis elegans]|uniref:Saposin B-type domain-containing protein n=1 Tax=Caenorhabditis elegans TaxID=6239 RepID=Q95XA3_CAEEL|nr:Saposin B-type domain-containing protein [Caenorhabditis elegans]CCD66823.1 Saposin B-type domain-containing protein [Caenorhabditis elegans]|eukprot:NP_740915.1 Uncharacterized protein CELE_Y37F4.3 [Caenorhabditis elegans]
MKIVIFCLILGTIIQGYVAENFWETACSQCNVYVDMWLPENADSFFVLSDLVIKNTCSKFPGNIDDPCYTLINLPVRFTYNTFWTFLSPFRELICVAFCSSQ